jgi:RNA polymerase sigma-70 factor (ECF subfamily)
MIDEPNPQVRERARRALDRTLRNEVPPPDTLIGSALLAPTEAALRSLPDRQREIFLAVRLDGMSYGEIAQRTELSVRKVERELARALAQIDRDLEQGEASPPRSWRRRLWHR